jgi:hypothetical protein
MKRLFTVNGEHFATKKEAKTARGAPVKPAINKTPAQYAFEIHKGPDHIGNHGKRVPATRHRAPQGGFEPKAS